MRRYRWPFLISLSTVLLLGLCAAPPYAGAVADDPAAPSTQPPPSPVRRIYDVTDLVREPAVDAETSGVVPPTELAGSRESRNRGGGGGGGGGGLFGGPSPQSGKDKDSSRIGELIKLIAQSVAPDTWRERSGNEGQISTFETRLVVTATPVTHSELAGPLADLRRHAGRTVRLRATWAALSEEELQRVLRPAPPKPTGVARTVDLAALESIPGAVRLRGEINALHGYRVNLTTGRARSVLTNLDAVVGNNASTFEPQIELVLAGAAFQVTALLSDDGAHATLDLRATLSRWDAPDAPPIRIPLPVASSHTRPVSTTFDLERLNMPVQLVATLTKVPTGAAALVSGMTADPDHGDRRPLYLIVETYTPPSASPPKPSQPAKAP